MLKQLISGFGTPKNLQLIGKFAIIGGVCNTILPFLFEKQTRCPTFATIDKVDSAYSNSIMDVEQMLSIFHPTCDYPQKLKELFIKLCEAEKEADSGSYYASGKHYEIVEYVERVRRLVYAISALPVHDLQQELRQTLDCLIKSAEDILHNITLSSSSPRL